MLTNRLPAGQGDLVGRCIGGYVIESLLGEGGMGAVYCAMNHRLGRKAAIKVISREYTQNAEIVGRFFREAQTVAAVDDPNIIEIYDSHEFSEDGLTYIAMKFIEGHSLAALSELMGPMPIDVAGAIALQIASGLDAAHELGIVHRDIKPHNILISRRWRRRFFVTIVDFGIAKLLDPHLASSFRTKTSLVVGTIPYMAPEQARGDRDVDARADIYSLGVVLYELLTGRKPYNDDTVYGLVEKQARRVPFPRPRELRADIPQVIDEALLAALQIDRKKRLGSIKEFAQLIARGLTNGDRLLTSLASRLCVDAPPAHNEPTLTGDVEGSLTRWTPVQSTVRRPVRSFAPFALAVAAGAALGGVVTRIATSNQAEAAPVVTSADVRKTEAPHGAAPPGSAKVVANDVPRVDASTPHASKPFTAQMPLAAKPETKVVAAPAPVATPAPAATPAQVAKLDERSAIAPQAVPAVTSAAKPIVTTGDNAVVIPMPKSAEIAKPSPRPEEKATARPEQRAVVKAPEKPEQKSAAKSDLATVRPVKAVEDSTIGKNGTLIVRMQTWAEVWVDGKRSGTAPLRLDVTAGRHSILLINDSHRESVPVNVGAKGETVIDKDW